MAIQIYNTMTRQKEEFTPIEDGRVRMYVCGPTVYDFLHIGNYRGAIFFNVVRNWLEHRGYQVNYIYNYTDVDDKIINRANEEGVDHKEISERFIEEFEKDYELLRLRPHTKNPRVSEHMTDIIAFIKDLVDLKRAYVIDGEVYYDVQAFENYGKLSNKKIEDLEAGFRIDVDQRKKHSADFALWKSAKKDEPHWDSPWGPGRPGWHIECSAMNYAILGETIDIHGGGLDLLFPHHENEIAQSEGRTGKPFVRYWMHNNMLEFGKQKMSKSLGNVLTGRAFLEKYDGEILKYMILQAHYRSTIDFSESQVNLAVAALARIYSSLTLAKKILNENVQLAPLPDKFQKLIEEADNKITRSMDDDFNTPEALAQLFEVVRTFNSLVRTPGKITPEKKAVSEVFYHWLRNKGSLLALFQEEPEAYLRQLDDRLLEASGLNRKDIDALVDERSQARRDKDYKKSDELRDRLTKMGISLQDSPEGTLWEVDK